jgi:TatD DNase family protein
MNLYDAHQHFHFDQLVPHRATIIRDLATVGLRQAVVNGTNEEEWPVVAALAREYRWIVPSLGIHPWDCGNRGPDWLKKLREVLTATDRAGGGLPTKALAAVGEVGLDRWIIDGLKPDDPRLAGLRVAPLTEQCEVFAAQLALGAELNRAVSIHCVQAWGALHDVLKKTSRPERGFLLHGYAGPAEMIRNFADLGAYFSFNIQLLEPRHASRLDNFRHIPTKRLLVETDAPTKPPAGDRNRFPLPPAADGSPVNHPANIAVAYAALAELRGVSLDLLAPQLEQNFKRLFL